MEDGLEVEAAVKMLQKGRLVETEIKGTRLQKNLSRGGSKASLCSLS